MASKTIAVHTLADLSSVQLTVVVRYGWRARIAAMLIHLAKWIGRNQVTFVGDEHARD
jgi:hypothetical protein